MDLRVGKRVLVFDEREKCKAGSLRFAMADFTFQLRNACTSFSTPYSSTKRISHPHSRLPRRSLIQSNIIIQLPHLLVDLRLICVALRRLNLQDQNFQLQFQHLVLDLPVLQGGGFGVVSGGVDAFVESAGADFGVLGDLALVVEGLEVFCGDGGEVGDLERCYLYEEEGL